MDLQFEYGGRQMKRLVFVLLLTLVVCGFELGCSADGDNYAGSSGDGDTDTDSDIDGGGAGDADSDSDADADADADTVPEGDGGLAAGCQMMDILFVIDDSGSMACEQTMLGQAFPQFVQVIDQFNNANASSVDYRLGVTSTGRSVKYTTKIPGLGSLPLNEKGMDGKLATTNGLTDPWIDGPGDPATISSQFSSLANLGTGGPGYEMPLEAMRMSLQKMEPGEVNDGFLREDALFIVVVITDEDDCSRMDNDFTVGMESCNTSPIKHNLVDLEEYRNYMNDKFGGFEQWVFVAIAGKDGCDGTSYPISCGDPEADGANKAVRLQNFVANYVNDGPYDNGLFSDICTTNLSDALAQALDKMEVACEEYQPPAVK
jgi:hypothetical protein